VSADGARCAICHQTQDEDVCDGCAQGERVGLCIALAAATKRAVKAEAERDAAEVRASRATKRAEEAEALTDRRWQDQCRLASEWVARTGVAEQERDAALAKLAAAEGIFAIVRSLASSEAEEAVRTYDAAVKP